jgi:hypothetical protein
MPAPVAVLVAVLVAVARFRTSTLRAVAKPVPAAGIALAGAIVVSIRVGAFRAGSGTDAAATEPSAVLLSTPTTRMIGSCLTLTRASALVWLIADRPVRVISRRPYLAHPRWPGFTRTTARRGCRNGYE